MPENLADLIAAHKGVRSYGDLSKASGVASSMWQRWGAQTGINASNRPIEIDSIRAIAQTLGVPERRVWLAVGATHGLQVAAPSETDLDLALAGKPVSDLTPGQVDLIVAIIDELVAAQARRQDQVGAPVRQLRAARKATGSEERATPSKGRYETLDPPVRDAVREAYATGMNVEDLVERFSYSEKVIRAWIETEAAPAPKGRRTRTSEPGSVTGTKRPTRRT